MKTDHPVRRGIVSQDGKRVFVQMSTAMRGYGRWGSYETEALMCLEMADGKRVWRSTQLADEPTMVKGKKANTAANISQIMELGGVLYAYDQVSNIGSDHHGDLYAFDANTGEQKWHYFDTNEKTPIIASMQNTDR